MLPSYVAGVGLSDEEKEAEEQLEATKNLGYRLRTLAHEIGHILVGGGHPGSLLSPPNVASPKFAGVSPLPGTAHWKRLLYSRGAAGYIVDRDDLGHLLVKKEWDKAETWLTRKFNDKKGVR